MRERKINLRKIMGLAAMAALLMGAIAPRLHAQTNNQVILDAGTVIPVRLQTELSSNQSQPGDTFTATVDDSKPAYNSLMRGATVEGVVRQATPQSGTTPGTLNLSFTRLRLPDGRSYSISGEPTNLDSKDIQARADGVLVAKANKQQRQLTYAGIGAGAGVLADMLAGGKLRIGDILLGGALGYAAGTLLKGPQDVHDVDLKPGTQMGVLLDNPARYYHQTSRTAAKHSRVTSGRSPRR